MAERERVVDFANPPVTEVVFGAMFAPLRGLQTPHLGRLWATWAELYPRCQDVPPLPPVIEELDGPARVTFTLSNLPELPRVWLLSEDNKTIVQLQRDRLHVNQRRLGDEPYEGFEEGFARFSKVWKDFTEFAGTTFQETFAVGQLELTYVNLIPACELFSAVGDAGKVFPDLSWRQGSHPFLGEPEVVDWTTTFRLPEKLGRLHVAVRARTARPDEATVFNMELTARGRPEDGSDAAQESWFRKAREAIDQGFVELTEPRMHTEIWRRTR
jgi:uncharacterized protein (TIGR04255 family)